MQNEKLTLNNIRDIPSAAKNRKRVGRGPGSGTGKTSGKGGKGQTARSGVSIGLFEGGQTPLRRRLPKRGQARSPKNLMWKEFTLEMLSFLVEHKKIEATITPESLKKAGKIKTYHKLVIIGDSELTTQLHVTADRFTTNAKAMIEKASGSCTIR